MPRELQFTPVSGKPPALLCLVQPPAILIKKKKIIIKLCSVIVCAGRAVLWGKKIKPCHCGQASRCNERKLQADALGSWYHRLVIPRAPGLVSSHPPCISCVISWEASAGIRCVFCPRSTRQNKKEPYPEMFHSGSWWRKRHIWIRVERLTPALEPWLLWIILCPPLSLLNTQGRMAGY